MGKHDQFIRAGERGKAPVRVPDRGVRNGDGKEPPPFGTTNQRDERSQGTHSGKRQKHPGPREQRDEDAYHQG
ncbi:hypothetical protein AOC05_10830 [Arthrobacter alpinus]|uniref:Uncharacterized protein n=1 Tax=Arthrobacter alpinus TaxID=656366 RepID=A0A0M4RQ13_9MICC|nr:hypothetical protein AOC05_10830 [Arthrobacter alpinus]